MGVFDLVEHVPDDARVFAEIARVVRNDGILVVSSPLHAGRWTPLDDLVGHYRRYEPRDLLRLLGRSGFSLEESAAFGMQPRSRPLLRFGIWMLRTHRERAMWWYNRILLPVGIYSRKPLRFAPGVNAPPGVDQIVAVCRRR